MKHWKIATVDDAQDAKEAIIATMRFRTVECEKQNFATYNFTAL